MAKLVSSEEMRRLEREAGDLGLPGPALMENAGRAVADCVAGRYPPNRFRHALVVVGPGNNGGDGLVAARHLHDAGYRVTVYFARRPVGDDAKILLLRERGIPLLQLSEDPTHAAYQATRRAADLVLDAVFGTGRLRPIEEPVATILAGLREDVGRKAVVAVDLPSGVDADTGAVDPQGAAADLTVTLGHPKRGLVIGAAAERVGEIVVVPIGIPAELARDLPVAFADPASVAPLLPGRPRVSHKGAFGRVLVVAGSALYTGAPVLAALGAERSGAGLVTVACPRSVRPDLAAHTLESTFLPLPDHGTGTLGPAATEPLVAALDDYRAILVGPGIGRAAETAEFLADFLPRLAGHDQPLVLDADALTLISRWPRWWERLPTQTILTPHPGEMARLTGPVAGSDRIELARTSAGTWHATVVLKGPYSVVAAPDGQAVVLPFANPALATAGTGDVLAGSILGLLGQGAAPFDAAVAGAFVHGRAGEILRECFGVAGGLAADLARALPAAQQALREAPSRPLP